MAPTGATAENTHDAYDREHDIPLRLVFSRIRGAQVRRSSARGTSVRLTHDRFDFGRGVLEFPSGTLELISHSLAQGGNAGLKALHFSQHFIDRIERLFESIFCNHVVA